MSFFRSIFRFIGLVLNVLCSIAFLASAYSPYLSPVRHPVWACAGLAFPVLAVLMGGFLVFWLLVYRRMVWLPFLTLCLGWGSLTTYFAIGSRSEPSAQSFKVLTYNIAGFPKEKQGSKEHSILTYLKNSEADIICLQEFRTDGAVSSRQVKKALAAYPYMQKTRLGGGWSIACYSRYPILSARKIDYKSRFNGSVCYRLKVGEDTVVVINNHLESNKLDRYDRAVYNELLRASGEEELKEGGIHLLHKLAEAAAIRAPQADAVAEAVRQAHSPYIIVCGDFNDSPVSYAHRVLAEELSDAFVRAGRGLGISYHEGGFYFRIDHLFVGEGFAVKKCVVDRSIDASDHYPVWCILEKHS